MVSIGVATKFLSYFGFSLCDASSLMSHFDNQMSRLMIASQDDLIRHGIVFDQRLHLLRAIRCFQMENWSKTLMNHFRDDRYRFDRFEKLIFHLMKFRIWMFYTLWRFEYVEKFIWKTSNSIDNDDEIRSFVRKLQHVETSIVRLKQMILQIKRHLS